MALLSLEQYKALAGVDTTNDQDDVRIEALMPAVDRALASYCDRKFEVSAGPPTERTFSFDGDGIVEIDDCTAVVSVATDAGVLGESFDLDASQWTAQPSDNTPTYYYLQIHSGPFHSFSPEMGFERNLDTYEPFNVKPVTVTVLANWGWPEIPADVQLAAAWMIQDIVSKPGGDNLQSESIEGFARSWAGTFAALSIPNRSRDLLVNYQRVF